MPANLENSPVVTGLEKVSFHSSSKDNAKECSNYHTIALVSHASKVMLKILQMRLQKYMNQELPDIQARCRKGRGTADQTVNICGSSKNQEISRKTSALLTTSKPLTVWITINCGKFFKRWEYQTTWPASWEICKRDKKQQIQPDMEQQTGSKLGKEYIKAQGCILLLCLFNLYAEYIMINAGLVKHKLEIRLLGEISITSDMQMIPPLWQIVKKN